MRLNVYVPDELAATVKAELPDINVSAVLQRALQERLGCEHAELTCSCCALPVSARSIIEAELDDFFRHLLWRITDLIHQGGTAEGVARVVIDSGRRRGIRYAATAQQPRLSRSQRQAITEAEEFAPPPPRASGHTLAGSVSQHPSAGGRSRQRSTDQRRKSA